MAAQEEPKYFFKDEYEFDIKDGRKKFKESVFFTGTQIEQMIDAKIKRQEEWEKERFSHNKSMADDCTFTTKVWQWDPTSEKRYSFRINKHHQVCIYDFLRIVYGHNYANFMILRLLQRFTNIFYRIDEIAPILHDIPTLITCKDADENYNYFRYFDPDYELGHGQEVWYNVYKTMVMVHEQFMFLGGMNAIINTMFPDLRFQILEEAVREDLGRMRPCDNAIGKYVSLWPEDVEKVRACVKRNIERISGRFDEIIKDALDRDDNPYLECFKSDGTPRDFKRKCIQ